MKKTRAYLIILGIILLFYLTPTPEGLSPEGWKLCGLFISAIAGLILKPFPIPVVFLAVIALSGLTLGNIDNVLRGYASTTTWTVFSALALSNAILTTGLGKRIAYVLIKVFGRTTLGLGYVLALLDLIIAPCTPSVVARSGSIVFTVANSISESLDSRPKESPRKIGAYLMMNAYLNTKSTAYIFLTASTPNLLILPFINDILKVEITWMNWFLAGVVPGIITLLLTPLIIYLVYPPELKILDNRRISQQGLAELGEYSLKEKKLSMIFVAALLGWIVGSFYDLDASVVAILAFVIVLITGVLSWDDILKSKGAWNVLIWFGGVLGLSSAMSKEGVFTWIGSFISQHIELSVNSYASVVVIVFISIIIRYFIVSGSAYVVAMMPVFFTIGLLANIPPALLGISLAFSAVYGSGLTHYGSAPGPIIFSAEYVSLKAWWSVGAVIVLMIYLIHMTLGIWWWKTLGWFSL